MFYFYLLANQGSDLHGVGVQETEDLLGQFGESKHPVSEDDGVCRIHDLTERKSEST